MSIHIWYALIEWWNCLSYHAIENPDEIHYFLHLQHCNHETKYFSHHDRKIKSSKFYSLTFAVPISIAIFEWLNQFTVMHIFLLDPWIMRIIVSFPFHQIFCLKKLHLLHALYKSFKRRKMYVIWWHTFPFRPIIDSIIPSISYFSSQTCFQKIHLINQAFRA